MDADGDMNDRTCIVTREPRDPDELLRFVAGPDGNVVPDLKRRLPGRGCWVTAERNAVDKAVAKNLFARALKAEVRAAPDLGATVDRLLAQNALGSLGLARKAGQAVTGWAQVDKAVRTGRALVVLHATDAAADGMRKIDQARRVVEREGGPEIPAFALFSGPELDLALGSGNAIHAAVLAGQAGEGFARRAFALARYRGIDAAARVSGGTDGRQGNG